MRQIINGHSAENIKPKIEEIVNEYNFDKSNIIGII